MRRFAGFSTMIMLLLLVFLSVSQPAGAASKPVVYFGDSHSSGAFGEELDRLLRDRYHDQVYSYSQAGSQPKHWITGESLSMGGRKRIPGLQAESWSYGTERETPVIGPILAGLKPRTVIVAHGTNLLGFAHDQRVEEISRLLRVLKEKSPQARCIWVGPPALASRWTGKYKDKYRLARPQAVEGVYAALRDAITETKISCHVVDSRKCTQYPPKGGDGIHYRKFEDEGLDLSPMGTKWAQCVYSNIDRILLYPKQEVTPPPRTGAVKAH